MKKWLLMACLLPWSIWAQLEQVSYKSASHEFTGWKAVPKNPVSDKPGVLILPAWMGITAHEKEVAQELSDLGYHVFIADIYGKGHYPKSREEAAKQSGRYKSDRKAYQEHIRLALDQLVRAGANPKKLAAVGYCFGGLGTLEMARAQMPVLGVVSVHGSLDKDPNRINGPITTKVLILHGADDPFVSKEEIASVEKELRDGKADWYFISYGNAVHAYSERTAGTDHSQGVAYNKQADERSRRAYVDFFREIFNSDQ